ncbi:hypothetical protein [Pedobacter jeongneungensis]|uniref:hypothetical protein n=1 Tax=Pedobacter jeongneungensis TaxID=947309 RepID=UPI0013B453D2|nr:hypothetical protein [Pedobacter jeongneungensis]
MNKILAVIGFILVGAGIQVLIKLFITENIFVVSLGSGIWIGYMAIWYNKKFGKKIVS